MIVYNPSVFKVDTIEQAKGIILTGEGEGATSEVRWEKEAPVLLSMMKQEWGSVEGKMVVDYGCGIGRLSKLLCENGATVVGVDMSEEMRRLAIEYVGSKRFIALSPEQFSIVVEGGFRCDYALAVWVLQHCLTPQNEIDIIKKTLNGGLMVLNNSDVPRAVPVNIDDDKSISWCNDGIDLWKLIDDSFAVSDEYDIKPSLIGLNEKFYRCVFYKSK